MCYLPSNACLLWCTGLASCRWLYLLLAGPLLLPIVSALKPKNHFSLIIIHIQASIISTLSNIHPRSEVPAWSRCLAPTVIAVSVYQPAFLPSLTNDGAGHRGHSSRAEPPQTYEEAYEGFQERHLAPREREHSIS